MQVLKIGWGSDSEVPKICCPICGTPEDPENSDYCKHLNFIYLPGHDEFEYVADLFAATVAALKSTHGSQSDDDDTTMLAHLENLPSTGTNFIIHVSGDGIACGPTTFTACYGFDLANDAE